jgi:hypothetical protein
MNNINTKNINRMVKGQGFVFAFCALFCLIWLLSIPSVKVYAWGEIDNTIVDAVYDWAAFVPDRDKIKNNPSLLAYCYANDLEDFDEIFIGKQTSDNSDSDTVDRSNGRFVGS